MSVKVRLFYPALQELLGGVSETEVEGRTVGECLADLCAKRPGIGKLLLDQHGRLLKRVYVFVNTESLQKAEFSKAVTEGDVLILAVLATGG
jgi:molybdopterin converting factor small subunit